MPHSQRYAALDAASMFLSPIRSAPTGSRQGSNVRSYVNTPKKYESLITFVKNRPGHDRHYAIDASRIERELGWKPEETFETGLRKTVQWYLDYYA